MAKSVSVVHQRIDRLKSIHVLQCTYSTYIVCNTVEFKSFSKEWIIFYREIFKISNYQNTTLNKEEKNIKHILISCSPKN